MKIRIGTRGSELALWQAHFIAGKLGKEHTEIVIIKTKGDQIQNVSFDKIEGKGFFTKEIEAALLDRRIDLAVHSLKDLTTEMVPGLTVAAIPEREEASDVILYHKASYDPSKKLLLKDGAIVGTSSMRRLAQLKHIDSTLTVTPLRGNINTRVRKLKEGQYAAIVLAYAGIKRIGLDIEGLERFIIPREIFISAPAQGALGLQTRADDHTTLAQIQPLNHPETRITVSAERSFLMHFGGGCHTPLGAHAVLRNDTIQLTGLVAATDGSKSLKETLTGTDPKNLGAELATLLKQKGAGELI